MLTFHRPAGVAPTFARGYSALELLVVLTVAAIIFATVISTVGSTLRTYRRVGAARQLLAEIRSTQSVAVSRHGTYGLQWGAGPGVGLPADRYRVVRDLTGACSFPNVGVPADDNDVIQDWRDLGVEFNGVTIQSITDNSNQALGGVMFDSLGASVNTCVSADFPVRLVVADPRGATETIVIRSAGGTRLL